MSITFPEGVIVSPKTIITNAYMLVLLAIMVWGPLIALHGYRQWWAVLFYAEIASAFIGGSIIHYRTVRRNRMS
jgi:hypothetical protein